MPRQRTAALRTREILIPLSDEDRIRACFTLQRSEPVEIMVQLECWIDAKWVPVRRYDTSHGYLHVHLEPWKKRGGKRRRVNQSLKEALTAAINEFKEHWESYRTACETARVGEKS